MKKDLLYALFVAVFFFPAGEIAAQCTFLTTPVAGPTLQTNSGTSTRSGLAWNPFDSLYYSVNAGSSNYPLETFSASGGTSVFSATASFDFRGAWWNPTLNQFEGNGYNTAGIRNVSLSALGYATSAGTAIFTGSIQPNSQSCGVLDYDDYEIIYYDNGAIHRYSRTTGTSLGSRTLTGLPVAQTSLTRYCVLYTGCSGNEYGVYDYINRRVYLFDKITGAFSISVQLPAAAPTPSSYGVTYANDMVWIFNSSTRVWQSYQFIQACAPPTATVTLNGSASFCQGDSTTLQAQTAPGLTYEWTLNGQSIPGANDSTFVVNQSGSYQLVAASGACRDTSAAQIITVNPLPTVSLTPGGSSSFCDGDSFTLSANMLPGASYQWFDGGQPISGATGMTYAATNGGSYTVEISDSNGCSALSAASVLTTTAPPAAMIAAPSGTEICDGDSLNLVASPNGAAFNYQWYENGNPIPGATSDTYSASTMGSYTVVVMDTNACMGTSAATSVTVFPSPNPILTISNDTLIAPAGFVSYQWALNGNDISGATSSSYVATTTGQYSVTVTDTNGCEGSSAMFNVIVGLDTELFSSVELFPNPGREVLNLNLSGMFIGELKVEVYDLQGRILKATEFNKNSNTIQMSLDTRDFPAALYHIRIQAGEQSLVKKWVKK